jgi:hypothetical protein
MADRIAFDPPIIKDLKGNPGAVTFQSVDDLAKFVQHERDTWNRVLNESGPKSQLFQQVATEQRSPVESLMAELAQVRNLWAQQTGGAQRAQVLKNFRAIAENCLDRWANGTAVHSDSPKGRMVLAVAENKVAMWVLALLQRRGRGMASNEPHDVLALQDAMAIVDGQQNRGAAEVEALQKAAAEVSGQLGEYMDQYQKLLKEQRENLALSKTEIKSTQDQLETLSKTAKGQFDGLAQKVASDFEIMSKKTAEDFEAFRQAHKDMLAIGQPVDYWSRKAHAHLWNMMGWGLGFVLLLMVTILAVVLVGVPRVQVLTNAMKSDDVKATAGLVELAVITVPLFFAVWLIRVLSRLFSLNVGLYWDAKERVAMATTFVALQAQSGGLKDAERAEVMKSLFRPAAVTGDDGAPGLIEALLGRLTAK